MKTTAAVMWNQTGPFEISELELDGPREDEVLVRFDYAGLCHTDEHMRNGDLSFQPPMVGGHEGSGVIEEVGPGVRHLKPGDHFVTSWMPSCGRCRFCVSGQSNPAAARTWPWCRRGRCPWDLRAVERDPCGMRGADREAHSP